MGKGRNKNQKQFSGLSLQRIIIYYYYFVLVLTHKTSMEYSINHTRNILNIFSTG